MVRITVFIAAAMMLALTACTAITDFEMPTGGKYDLGANIPATIVVTLAGDGTGSLVLEMTTEQLPDTGDQNAALLALLGDGTVSLTVQNDTTAVAFELLGNGEQVATAPTSPGQYTISIDETRLNISIQFYNETVDGSALQAGGDYSATIEVLDNAYFVATGATPIVRPDVIVN